MVINCTKQLIRSIKATFHQTDVCGDRTLWAIQGQTAGPSTSRTYDPVGKLHTVCLDHQVWDWQSGEVVVVKKIASTTNMIYSACHAPETNKTLLALMGVSEGGEIQL